jgi:hypothetical protein
MVGVIRMEPVRKTYETMVDAIHGATVDTIHGATVDTVREVTGDAVREAVDATSGVAP